jgi:hypothetical protein
MLLAKTAARRECVKRPYDRQVFSLQVVNRGVPPSVSRRGFGALRGIVADHSGARPLVGI